MLATLFLATVLARAALPAGSRVEEILGAAVAGSDPAVLAQRIAALGPEVGPDLLHAWAALERDGGDPARVEVLRRASRVLGRGALLPLLEPLAAGGDPAEQRHALEWLGSVGRGDDLVPGAALARDPASIAAFEEAACRVLERDRGAFKALTALAGSARADVCDACVRAVGRSASPAALEWLAQRIGERAGLDPLVLSSIEVLPERVRLGAEPEVRERVRAALETDDPQVLRKAALVVGKLGDFESVARLIELLASNERCAREGARAALVELTGLRFPERPEPWAAWYAAETTWFGREFPRLSRGLAEGDRARATTALLALGQHRYQRHALAAEVAGALARPEPEVRELACSTLAALGSRLALPALVESLSDPAPKVATAALGALRAITGRELPADPAAWRALP